MRVCVREWVAAEPPPPTLIPCLHKVLLAQGRKSALNDNIDKTRLAFWSVRQVFGFLHLQYIISPVEQLWLIFLGAADEAKNE